MRWLWSVDVVDPGLAQMLQEPSMPHFPEHSFFERRQLAECGGVILVFESGFFCEALKS